MRAEFGLDISDKRIPKRHRCDNCRGLFHCYPCPHYGNTGKGGNGALPRFCPQCRAKGLQ